MGPLMYGTAWKEDDTQRCVTDALAAGFRSIDTANQRKHYFEAGVGNALKMAFDQGMKRSQLFLQTKYTSMPGQDHRLPYSPQAAVYDQVHQSFASSLKHLHTDYLDSLILHGPTQRDGWSQADKDAWRAMEALAADGKVRSIGVSNVNRAQLDSIGEFAKVLPAAVQHRCYARVGWGADVREWCQEHGAVYQGFSLLTANRAELALPVVDQWATAQALTIPQLVFRFARQVGMWPLTGTTDRYHMEQDLAGCQGKLPQDVVDGLLQISARLQKV